MTNRTTGIAAAALILMLGGAAHAQVERDARQRLQDATRAMQEADSLTFHVTFEGTGSLGLLPKIETDVAMARDPERSDKWLVRLDGKTEMPDGSGGFLVVSDGASADWLDHANHQVLRRPIRAARGPAVERAMIGWPIQLQEDEPFAKELAAQTLTIQGVEEVGGVPCEVLLADPGDKQPTLRWAIGLEDNLPRRFERIIASEGFRLSQLYTIVDVQVDPGLTVRDIELAAPVNYTDTRPQAAPGGGGRGAGGETRTGTGARTRMLGTEAGDLAPDFELSTPQGEKVRLSSLRGNIVLLDFWGTWCLPCRMSGPEVQKLHERFQDKPVKVLGLAVRERSDEAPVAAMKDLGHTYGLLLRADDVARTYKVKAFPTFFVIGREGEILHVAPDYKPKETLEAIAAVIEKALGDAPAPPAAPPTPPTPAPGGGGDDAGR